MGKSTISMVMFNSYVNLPEGTPSFGLHVVSQGDKIISQPHNSTNSKVDIFQRRNLTPSSEVLPPWTNEEMMGTTTVISQDFPMISIDFPWENPIIPMNSPWISHEFALDFRILRPPEPASASAQELEIRYPR